MSCCNPHPPKSRRQAWLRGAKMLSGKCLGEEKWLSPPKVWESREGAMRARPPSKDEKSQRWVPGSLAKAWQSRRGGGSPPAPVGCQGSCSSHRTRASLSSFLPGIIARGRGPPTGGGASLANRAELPSPASGHVGCFPNLAAAWDA